MDRDAPRPTGRRGTIQHRQIYKLFLIGASPVDTIWGIGLSQDSGDIENIYAWRGQNLLGFALMATRDFIKEFGHFKQLDNSI